MADVVLAIGLFVFAAYLFKMIFDRTGIPDVLLLMLCGIVIGPLTGWVQPQDFGQAGRVLATLALVVILFESGVDLDLSSLRPSLSATLKIALSTFVVTAAIAAVAAVKFAGLTWPAALMLGVIVAGTSSAVVIPLVQGLKVQGKTRTVLILESALTDVLCIIGLFMLLDAAQKGATSPAHVVLEIVKTLLFAGAIGIFGGELWLMTLRRVRRFRHGGYASVAMCFICYGITELAGFSGAIAAIAFGIALANGRQIAAATGWVRPGRFAAFSSREHDFLKQIIFVLKTFFFVYLGITMRLDDNRILLLAALIVIAIYLCRHLIAGWLCDRDVNSGEVALTAAMVPKGLAAAVLAGLPLQAGISGGETIQTLANGIVLFSILLTALLIALQRGAAVRAVYAKLYRRPSPTAAASSLKRLTR